MLPKILQRNQGADSTSVGEPRKTAAVGCHTTPAASNNCGTEARCSSSGHAACRVHDIEGMLLALTAQARDVVLEIEEIKAEIKHINTLSQQQLGGTGSGRASERGASLLDPSTFAGMPGTMTHDCYSATGMCTMGGPTTAEAAKGPGKWPKFSHDTIQRFESGGGGSLVHFSNPALQQRAGRHVPTSVGAEQYKGATPVRAILQDGQDGAAQGQGTLQVSSDRSVM